MKCSICLRSLKRGKVIELICNHKYHEKCLNRWRYPKTKRKLSNTKCPICRKTIQEKTILHKLSIYLCMFKYRRRRRRISPQSIYQSSSSSLS